MIHVEMVTPAGRVHVRIGEVDAHVRRGCTFVNEEARATYNEQAAKSGWVAMGPETVYGAAEVDADD